MNTSTAATEAKVTVATIRTWCRAGVIAATKQAGRWIIDTASLAARIAIGKMKRPAKPIALTAEALVAIGGRRWQKNGMDRVYINDWAEFAGLEASYYKSGNVCGATFQGHSIANGRVGGILGAIDKVWFDAADGQLHARHYDGARSYEIRFYDGIRQTFDLVAATFAGIKAAVAAL
ncbi:helix-turn-helix domain-containing protein [Streptomyces collinus]|uniref:helix-turn-helix domain-containing protein n=1 Tax=Streptomyces collinus TaxID=42684 RepID=UPI0033B1B549